MRLIRTLLFCCLIAFGAQAGNALAVNIYCNDFDGSSPLTGWSRGDANSTNGLDYWGVSDCFYFSPSKSVWCAKNNHANENQCTHYYNSADAYLISPAIGVAGHANVHLRFNWKLELAGDGDYFAVYVSPDSINWSNRVLYRTQTVNSFYWQTDFDYAVPASWTSLFVKFRFYTNSSNWNYRGACIDDFCVTGSCVAGLAAAPTSLDFGTLFDGEVRDRSFTVTNTGCGSNTLTDLLLPYECSLVGGSGLPTAVQPGESRSFTVRFAPEYDGAMDDELCVENSAGIDLCLPVTGNVLPCHQPLTGSISSIDFGPVNIETCSGARSVTITSHSCRSVDLVVETPDGILEAGGVYSFTLAAGTSRTLSFQYCPDYVESLNDVITITGDLLPEDLEIPVSGTANECHQPLASSPVSIDFGIVNIGACSPARSITLTSHSCANVTVINIVRPDGVIFDGTPPPSPFVLAPGTSRSFSVKYCPEYEETLDDVLTVVSAELDDDLEIAVIGEAPPCDPVLEPVPEDVDFGLVNVGQTATRFVLLRNTAACGNLVISSVTSNASEFQPVYTTPRTIQPGHADTLRITFTPPDEEYYFGEIEIVSNDPGGPRPVYVEGEGGCARGITIISPNGGEAWPVGSTQLISWNSACLTGNVNIQLNRNYPFGTWESLFSNTANDGSQSWTVSGSTSTSARIRVMSVGTPVVGDTSSSNFTIPLAPPATITVIQPNGGEQLTVGVPYTILWQSSGVSGNVNIDWKTNYPSGSWVPLFTNTPNDGSQSWTPTSTASAARIRIRSAANSAVGDTSAANFTVVQPRPITVTQPNGGETLQPGQNYNITWSTTLSPTARVQIAIKYNYPSGSWQALVVNTLNDGVWNWTVPSVPPTCQARVRILNMANSAQGDTSDSEFCIGQPAGTSITVTVPNGGESWALNSVQTITWNAVNMPGNVRVQVNRTYPSAAWEDLAANTANDGNHSWTVTGPASVTCRVRVLDEATQSIGDTSNANFSVGAAGGPSIRVLTPNSGETLVIRQPYNITWTSSGISGNVAIQVNNYYPGNSWTNITTSTANDGSFSWTPLGPTTSSARIRILSVNSPTIGDTSDENFSIQTAAGNQPGGGGQIAGASADQLIPTEFYLANNYPNPFNAATTIEFGVPRDQHVVVSIYDVLGRQQVTLFEGVAEAGVHRVTWNPVSAPTGIYFFTLSGDGIAVAPRKMVYLK